MTFSIGDHTILLTLAGSQAHGTARAGSDVDLRGVCVVPLSDRLSLFHHFEQDEGELPRSLKARVGALLQTRSEIKPALREKVESVIFDIAKFVRLCAMANPNALEILFADPADWVIHTPAWRKLYDERYLFLTKKVQQTFLGYALAQLKKIKTHRSWLLEPPAEKPSREAFGLPRARSLLNLDDQNRLEQSLAEKVRSYGIDDVRMSKVARIAIQDRLERFYCDALSVSDDELNARMRAVASDALGIPASVINALNAEKRYRAAMRRWEAYQAWKEERNPGRAALEKRYGYDTKHAMHLIRLMRMGAEVLETGELLVRRPDADELRAIRDGGMAYDELLDAAKRLEERMSQAIAVTTLPESIDEGRVDQLIGELMSRESSGG